MKCRKCGAEFDDGFMFLWGKAYPVENLKGNFTAKSHVYICKGCFRKIADWITGKNTSAPLTQTQLQHVANQTIVNNYVLNEIMKLFR